MAKSSTPHQTVRSAEEIGFLAGGAGRAAQAVLARLMDGGLVRVSREGLVTAVHQNGYGATTPLEAHVLAGLRGTSRPISQVVQVAMGSHEMSSLGESLVARSLLRRRGRNRPGNGRKFFGFLLFLVSIGTIPVVFAFEPKVFFLTLVLLVVGIVLMRSNKSRLTASGKAVLRYTRGHQRGGADVVALYGLRQGRHRTRTSTSDGGGGCSTSYDWSHHSCAGSSSSCSSSSSSCGSSSSCSSSSSSSCSSSSSSSCSSSSS